MAITLEMLEAQARQFHKVIERLQKELELTQKMIALRKGHLSDDPSPPKVTAKSYSVRGRVVDAIIELIHNLGKQVGNKEILENLNERGISLGDTKNKQAMLAAILSQEIKKKSARLRKVARGIYDIKQ